MVEEKESIVGPIIGIIVVIVVFVAGVAFFVSKIDFHGSGNGSNNFKDPINGDAINELSEVGVSNGEVEVENYDVVNLLEEKTQHLLRMNYPERNPLFKKNMSVNDLSDVEMFTVALDMIDSESLAETYCYDKDSQTLRSNCQDNDSREVGDFVRVGDVRAAIKNIFGRDFTPQTYYQYCPLIGLSKEGDKYYLMHNCEGNVHDEELTYIYLTTEKDGKYFVYVAYGVFVNNNGDYVLYTDSENKNVYNENVLHSRFDINDGNYKNFSKYKFTFEKLDNNYYFSKIEKIEQ